MRRKKRFLLIVLFILIVMVLSLYRMKDKIGFYLNIINNYSEYLTTEYADLNKNVYNNESVEKIDSIDYFDIEYKNTNEKSLKLDMYGPEKTLRKGSPVIVYVHPGSWAYGNKDIPKEIDPVLKTFREEGYTIISVEYELIEKEEIFEKQVSDVKDAIRWVYKNKDIYDFNTENIGIIGISSGAHLGMMAAYSNNDDFIDSEDLKGYSSKVKYIIDLFGPTDLSTLEESSGNSEVQKSILNSRRNKEEIINKYSPINYVDTKEANTLIIHSKADDLVPYKNAEELYEKLKANKNEVELLTLEETNHDFSTYNNKELFDVGLKILKYIAKNM